MEMDCTDVTADRFSVDETPPAALHQTIIVPAGDTPIYPLEVLMVRAQVQGDILP